MNDIFRIPTNIGVPNTTGMSAKGYWYDENIMNQHWSIPNGKIWKKHERRLRTTDYSEPGGPIQHIKGSYTIEQVAKIYEHKTTWRGKYLSFKCPHPEHDDTNPSAASWDNKNWKCFSCQARGNVFDMACHLEASQ